MEINKNIFYNSNKLFSYNAIYSFVMGERGGGKTFDGKDRMLNLFIKKNKKSIYLRRTQSELDKVKDTLFDDIAKYRGLDIKVKGNGAYLDGKLFCYFMSLSTSTNYKSASYPDVDLIFFDEYVITQTGYNHYLKNEMVLLNDLVETVFRLRKPNVYICANAVSYVNPFFTFFNIEPRKGDRFIVRKLCIPKDSPILKHNSLSDLMSKYTGVVVEMTDIKDYKEVKAMTPFALLLHGTQYGDYAFNNETLEDTQDFIVGRKPSDYNYFRGAYRIDNRIIGVWSWDIHDSGVWVGSTYDVNSNWKYTLYTSENYEGWKNIKVDRYNFNITYIRECYLNGKCQYENQDTKKMFMDEVSRFL